MKKINYEIQLPGILNILDNIQNVKSTNEETTKLINEWVILQRNNIVENRKLINIVTDESRISIFKILIVDFLMRRIKAENGKILRENFNKYINHFDDLNNNNFKLILNESNYIWKKEGLFVIKDVVQRIKKNYNWNWSIYFDDVDKKYKNNFQEDIFLKVKYIGNKVRNLAISNFNNKYIAFDSHIIQVITRIGLLNYGFFLKSNKYIEMGNNPSNPKNYLFLHVLFLYLSETTNDLYSPVDIDRAFWHFGKTICTSNKPKCLNCPINNLCITGKYNLDILSN